MTQGSVTCTAVGTTSPRNSAFGPSGGPISTDWWPAVWPGVGTTRTPGAISVSPSTSCSSPASPSGPMFSCR